MITKVKAYTSKAGVDTLLLADPGSIVNDLLQITNITGLGPVKGIINTSEFPTIDGAAFTGSSIPSRNIVITLNPNPDWTTWTVETLRKLIYLYFQPKLLVQLVFEDSVKPAVTILGYVESCEPNQFTKDGTFQISIICPYPYFTSLDPIVVTGRTTNVYTPTDIDYNGDIESGIHVEVDAHTGETTPASIGVQTTDPATEFFTVATWIDANQKFVMNSVPGNKYVDNVRPTGNIVIGLLEYRVAGSQWPTLQPGTNPFSVITDAGSHDWTLTYFERFGGL